MRIRNAFASPARRQTFQSSGMVSISQVAVMPTDSSASCALRKASSRSSGAGCGTTFRISAIAPSTNTPVDLDAQDYFDISGIWNVTDHAALRLGISNLFDEEPPITDNGVTLRNNGNTYPGVYDHLGQYWFLGVSVSY